MYRGRIFLVVALTLAMTGCAYISRASVSTDGTQAGGESGLPSLSADGRYVAFASAAANLVAGDTNNAVDVFVHDNLTGTTERVSVASDGSQVHGTSSEPAISFDGRYVAFMSSAADLVPGDTNGTDDIFVRDRVAGTTTRVSVMPDGSQDTVDASSPSITFDGGKVVWVQPQSPTTFDVIGRDLAAGTSAYVATNSPYSRIAISADGHLVGMVGDCNGSCPGQLAIGTMEGGPSAVNPLATPGLVPNAGTNVAINGYAGRYVVFDANPAGPSGLPAGLYLIDTVTQSIEPVSVPSYGATAVEAESPSISADGRYVAFTSSDSTLVLDDQNSREDVFVRDRVDKITTRLSTTNIGGEATEGSALPSISADGRYVAFSSDAPNLVSDDTNAVADIFVKYAHTPSVDALNGTNQWPLALARGTTDRTLFVDGTEFMPGAVVSFGDGVTVTNVAYYSSQILIVTVSVDANATTGPRTVDVENVGSLGQYTGSAGWCQNCVAIT